MSEEMRILVTGAGGQLATELEKSLPENKTAEFLSVEELDITAPEDVEMTVSSYAPAWIVNAAAYTQVDKAEDEPELAQSVNAQGVANLAQVAKQCGARMVQVSTDYVFNGHSSVAYRPDAEPDPLNVYGRSKSDGDRQVLEILGDHALLVRTSWVYSSAGNNFVKTILRLCAEKPQLTIVADQIGTPTWAKGLAEMIWSAIDRQQSGICHWTDSGVASWYDFAVAIQDIGLQLGLLDKSITIRPIPSEAFPQKALRPRFSVLDIADIHEQLQLEPMHWRHALEKMMQEIADHG
ncbi:MAG: dTDP-4-dehydrorhamnose reductase [Chromatiales bacterium]|jgi:dTDP-4-dehydrorhamnose reductase